MSRERLSSGDALFLVVLLAVAGIVVSSYLTWQWYQAASSTWCDVNSYFSCSRVRESPYSAIGGIPTAVIGIVGFVLLLGLAVLWFTGRTSVGPFPIQRTLTALAAVGAAIGIGLTVIEVALIGAVCILCAMGFGFDLGILGLAIVVQRGVSRLDGLHGDEEVLGP